MNGGDGNDVIWVGSGADVENGGEGSDRLHALASDNRVDALDCGPGNDVAFLNRNENDTVVNCETVFVMVPTPAQAADDDR